MKTIIVLLALLFGTIAQAQDVRQWMPHRGERFYYTVETQVIQIHRGRETGATYQQSTSLDEVIEEDSTNRLLVAIQSTGENLAVLWFHLSDDTSALLPLVIENVDTSIRSRLDFSKSKHYRTIFNGDSITVFDDVFSPELGWFVAKHSSGGDYPAGSLDQEGERFVTNYRLTAVSKSAVSMSVNPSGALEVKVLNRNYLQLITKLNSNSRIDLLDPLGRPTRSWQLAASDGPREITLNVSDVPSGVYFLRLKGSGVDEVKRVAIIQ